jgi:hypothetical protein
MAGPAGAYGPMQQSPGQLIPGQMPPAGMAGMSMNKPGTIIGIQVILWIFLALSAVANLFSVMSMVEFFNPFSLIGLAFAVYSAIQSLASGVHISRGKRWAWIWSLVSAILGLALSLTAFVYGVIMFDSGGDIMLTVAAALTVLYGTLLGLLCSKSARQWILMHRIQRGEVQVPDMAGGMASMGGVAQIGMAQTGPAERPETRPVSATVAVVAIWLLAAISAYGVYNGIRGAIAFSEITGSVWDALFYGAGLQPGVHLIIHVGILIGAVIAAPLLTAGKAAGRVIGIVWSILALLAIGLQLVFLIMAAVEGHFLPPLPGEVHPLVTGFSWAIGRFVLALVAFILMFGRGVRAWTPGNSSGPIIMMVPMGQPQGRQPGPYGQPQQQFNQYQPPQQQQQPPYPPQY